MGRWEGPGIIEAWGEERERKGEREDGMDIPWTWGGVDKKK